MQVIWRSKGPPSSRCICRLLGYRYHCYCSTYFQSYTSSRALIERWILGIIRGSISCDALLAIIASRHPFTPSPYIDQSHHQACIRQSSYVTEAMINVKKRRKGIHTQHRSVKQKASRVGRVILRISEGQIDMCTNTNTNSYIAPVTLK